MTINNIPDIWAGIFILEIELTKGCILSPDLTNSAFPRPALATPLINDVDAPSPMPKANTLKFEN